MTSIESDVNNMSIREMKHNYTIHADVLKRAGYNPRRLNDIPDDQIESAYKELLYTLSIHSMIKNLDVNKL